MKTGPKVDREKLVVLGKYLDDALILAQMSQAELARRAKMRPPIISQVMRGTRTVGRDTLIKWCVILQCPNWLEECILNSAGYASREQKSQVETDQRVEAIHLQVMAALEEPPQE